ncbi:MAG TPA: hypothetical protein VFM88_19510, partial [Vicinamibacteria bacterium]|nr:hypothetical protein [Vicinamibacteria bacterium]
MQILELRARTGAGALLVGACVLAASVEAQPAAAAKVPITTRSEEARQLYLKGRDLVERLRATDARKYYADAAAKDPSFALAQLGLANSAGTAKEFFEATKAAVALSSNASEGERLMVLGVDAAAKADFPAQKGYYTKLVAAYPNDERAQNLLGAT